MKTIEELKKLDMPLFKVAYLIASDAHASDTRNDKKTPYMTHVDKVIELAADHVYSDDPLLSVEPDMVLMESIMVVAALHDVTEDHPDTYPMRYIARTLMEHISYTDLSRLSEIIAGIDAITKKPKGTERYTEYVKRVLSSRLATIVKRADLTHNMSDLGPGNMRDKYDLTLSILTYEL